MGPKIFQKSPFWEFLLFHLNSKIPSISLTHPNVVRFSKFLFRWKADENSYLLQTWAPPVHPLHPQLRNPCLCLIASLQDIFITRMFKGLILNELLLLYIRKRPLE